MSHRSGSWLRAVGIRVMLGAALLIAGFPSPVARPNKPESAVDASRRGQNLLNRGEYDQAVNVLVDAYERLKKQLGPEHPETLDALQSLSLAYEQRHASASDVTEALDTATKLRDARLRQMKPGIEAYLKAARSRIRLQNLIGLPIEVEQELQRMLSLQAQIYGTDSDEVIATLFSLAGVHSDMGDLRRAESDLRRAWELAEGRFLGPRRGQVLARHLDDWVQNPVYRQVLIALAMVSFHQGQHKEAQALAQRYLQGTQQYPRLVSDRAQALELLGAIARQGGDVLAAKDLWRQALALWQSAPLVSTPLALARQALYLLCLGRWAEAEALYRQALAALERTRGPASAQAAASLQQLAMAVAMQGRSDEAAKLLERSVFLSEARLSAQRYTFSEFRLSAHLRGLQDYEESYIYTLLLKHPQNAALRRLAMSTALLRKGRIVDELASTAERPSMLQDRELSEADTQRFHELRQLRNQYAALLDSDGETVSTASGVSQSAALRLRALSTQMDELARQVASRSVQFRGRTTPAPQDILERVARALPADAALIEYVAFAPRELDDGPVVGKERYLALGLTPDGKVEVWDLGAADEIDALASKLVLVLSNSASLPTEHGAAAAQLGRRIWEPLRRFAAGRRQLFIAPDAKLALVPFAVLPEGAEPLLDRYVLSYLTSGRDLVPRDADYRPHKDAVIIAYPDYKGHPGFGLRSSAWLGNSCNNPPLPGSQAEARLLCNKLPGAQVLCGKRATEHALLSLSAPGILHVATHGVFSAGQDASATSLPGQPPLSAPNPLLRSALVMAGADWQCDTSRREAELSSAADGMATAMELSNMNLWGTQLVVLSACKSGLGAAPRGQGVLGLRRAIMVAGAETLVVSLWKVDDEATKDLMNEYYQQLLTGVGRAEALQNASKMIRRGTQRPYFWAPFISLGQVTPLQLPDASASGSATEACGCR